MTVSSGYDQKVVLSPYIQGNWGTRLVDGSLTKSYPLKTPQPLEITPKWEDDGEEAGKGHEWLTRQDLEYWDTRLPLQFDLDAWMAAWIGAFGLGSASEAGPGEDSEYTHTCLFSDPDTVDRQNPYTSAVIYQPDQELYVPDLCVASFELAGQMKQRPTLSCQLVGSGRTSDASAFSFPSLSAADFLRMSGLQFQLGESGSLVNVSSKLRTFTLSVSNNLREDDGYAPGCGNYRSRLRYGKRELTFTFTLERPSGTTYKDFIEANTELQAVLTFTGAQIGAVGPAYYTLTITLEKGYLKAIPKAYEEMHEVINVEWTPIYNSDDQGPIKWAVVNTEAEFLKAEP